MGNSLFPDFFTFRLISFSSSCFVPVNLAFRCVAQALEGACRVGILPDIESSLLSVPARFNLKFSNGLPVQSLT